VGQDRRLAVIVGIAFIVATVFNLVGTALVSPAVNATDYLTRIAADQDRVTLGAFFLFVAAVACPAIAIGLYPVLRRFSEAPAIGAVGFRVIEGALYVLVAVCVLLLVSLSQAPSTEGSPAQAASLVLGEQLKAGRHWLGATAVLTFGLGAILYYWALYRTRLVPRWLSVSGLIAIVMVMASAVLVLFRVIDTFSAPQIVLALPIAVQEMVLAVWLIAKGFATPAPGSASLDQARRLPMAA